MSTVLNTAAKVIEIYGGTTWTQISGRFLLAANSTYAVKATGGSANAIIPYHRHSVTKFSTGAMSANASHSHTVTSANGEAYTDIQGETGTMRRNVVAAPRTSVANALYAKATSVAHTHEVGAHNTNYAGTEGNTTGANMPPYYAVYIWERTA